MKQGKVVKIIIAMCNNLLDCYSITWEHINIYDYLWVKLSERDRGGVCQP